MLTPNYDLKKTETGKIDKRDARPEREILIGGLNHDLAGEFQAILMYVHFSSRQTGPYRRQLRTLFQEQVADELRHAQFLADKIVALGGVPTTEPQAVPHTAETREMLEHALTAERQAIADYGERSRQAEAFGDIGLRVALGCPGKPGRRRDTAQGGIRAHSRRLE